jgi:multidrug efflux pump subunit AcrA (membrane-fusion protein)
MVVVVVVTLSLSCGAKPAAAPAAIAVRAKAIVVKEEKSSSEVKSFGSISFKSKADLSAAVEGTLISFPFKEGGSVRKGQRVALLKNVQLDMRRRQALSSLDSAKSALLIAEAKLWEGELQVESRVKSIEKAEVELEQKRLELEETERTLQNKDKLLSVGGATEESVKALRLSAAAARASYISSEKDLEIRRIGLRDEDLVSRGMVLPSGAAARTLAFVRLNTETLSAEVEAAKSRVEAAQMDLESVDQLLGELEITAPDDGIVGAKYAELGERVQANAKVATLIQTSSLYAVFPLREEEASRVVEGMPVEVVLDAFPDRSYPARVEIVSPTIDPQSGSVTVKAALANPGQKLRPGMFARVKVRLGAARTVIRIPETAIAQKSGKKARVFAVVLGKAFAKDVDLGSGEDGSYIVEGGLKAGDTVIDSPSPLLKEGEGVEIAD